MPTQGFKGHSCTLVVAALVGTGLATRLRGAQIHAAFAISRQIFARMQRRSARARAAARLRETATSLTGRVAQRVAVDRVGLWGSRLECRPPTTWQQSQPSSSLESAPAVRSLHCSWFNAIAFSVAAIPLVSFAIAPDATRARID